MNTITITQFRFSDDNASAHVTCTEYHRSNGETTYTVSSHCTLLNMEYDVNKFDVLSEATMDANNLRRYIQRAVLEYMQHPHLSN